MSNSWIAKRTENFNSSGIRKVFDLASKLDRPINLSIGQPEFDVPEPIKEAMVAAVHEGKNAYSPTQGIAPLREKLEAQVSKQISFENRKLFVCSGTSGGLVLSLMAMVNPGDEVIIFDPCFVMYESLIHLAAGVPVRIDSYPDFRMSAAAVEQAITPKTKAIIVNSPGNPTGVQATVDELKEIAALAKAHNIALISDEIYREFCYDTPFVSPAEFNADTIVIDGFSKTYAMTGWRLGFVHGPPAVIDAMIKIQQYSFVCAPQPVQWAGLAALDFDMSDYVDSYREKRNKIVDGLAGYYELQKPDAAFYAFPKLPWGTGDEFVQEAIANNLLVIPGHIFSRSDTHFRISYAASNETLDEGIEILQRLAKRK